MGFDNSFAWGNMQKSNRKHKVAWLIFWIFNNSFSLSRNKYIKNCPSPRSVTHSFWVICRNISRTIVELCMETPYFCTVFGYTNMAAGNQQKHLEITYSIKALPFHPKASIRAHKHIFHYLKWLNCWKSAGEAFFQRDSIPIFCHALWKLGSSNCCSFEMKHATGLETCTRIYIFVYLQPCVTENS